MLDAASWTPLRELGVSDQCIRINHQNLIKTHVARKPETHTGTDTITRRSAQGRVTEESR